MAAMVDAAMIPFFTAGIHMSSVADLDGVMTALADVHAEVMVAESVDSSLTQLLVAIDTVIDTVHVAHSMGGARSRQAVRDALARLTPCVAAMRAVNNRRVCEFAGMRAAEAMRTLMALLQ